MVGSLGEGGWVGQLNQMKFEGNRDYVFSLFAASMTAM